MQNDRVKSAQELALMRRAAAVTDDVYDCLLASVREGVTERELADLILRETLRLGAEGVSFDTIVAFGESGAEPHHVPTDKRLEHGMLVTVDMGAVVYDIVHEAQEAGMARVAPGVACRAADAAARDIIAAAGYGEQYIHGTGHGVGREIHESPTLNPKSEETLLAGQVVTVEPGIYIPGRMGVRIEDMVLVGEGRPFSRHNTELLTLR